MSVMIAAGSFLADLLLTIDGSVAGLGYTISVLVASRSPVRSLPLSLALATSLLTGAEVLLSPLPTDWLTVIVSRGASLGGIWIAAWFAKARRSELRGPWRTPDLQEVLLAAMDAVVIVDAMGVITQWNPAAEVMFGRSPSETLGKLAAEIILPPAHRNELPTALHDYMVTGTSPRIGCPFELSGLRATGDEFSARFTIAAFRSLDAPLFCLFVRDISNEESTREEMERFTSELDLRNREIEEIVSIVAHDLKRPIVSISGLLGLVREDLGDSLDPESAENLDLSLAECDRMKTMVTELRAIAKAEQRAWDIREIELADLLSECARAASELAEQREARVEVDTDTAQFRASRRHVVECITNLIENALKYGCPNAGMSVKVIGRCSAGLCTISVADLGPGIPESEQTRVFELFRRGSEATNTAGTGVGLFSVRRLVQQIGGTISLSSKVGQGTTFSISFPVMV